MLEKVKPALRVKSAAFDGEIEGLIAACLSDLRIAGINTALTCKRKALIERAVILYCKANFGYFEGGDRYAKAYEELKIRLSLAGEYRAK